jgi:hypothetical protein
MFVAGACTPTPRSSSTTLTATRPTVAAESPSQSCRLTVTDTEGCAPEEVAALVASVRPRLEACHGSSGGKVRIKIIHHPEGGFTFAVQPGASLNPTERQCILDALATMNETGTSTGLTGLSVPATGFTSHLTIEF